MTCISGDFSHKKAKIWGANSLTNILHTGKKYRVKGGLYFYCITIDSLTFELFFSLQKAILNCKTIGMICFDFVFYFYPGFRPPF